MQNSKLQFSQSDLLKLLSYLEGELQARDVVIAALKVQNCCHFKRRSPTRNLFNLIFVFFFLFHTVGKIEKYYQYKTP